MVRYQGIVLYDGSEFQGFQRLTSDAAGYCPRTVQGVLEAALRELGWTGRAILAAGRTDAGVHARGQVIAFDLEWKHSTDDLLRALNARLPNDIALTAVQVVAADFHPRYDAKARMYRYRLFCQEYRNPLEERYAWRIWPALDRPAVQEASSYLVGVHDFAAFGNPPKTGGCTIRRVLKADWQWSGQFAVFEIVANAFLFHMVRRMVALLVEIGQGKFPSDIVLSYLTPDRSKNEMDSLADQASGKIIRVQGLAPAHGLFLEKVFYQPFEI